MPWEQIGSLKISSNISSVSWGFNRIDNFARGSIERTTSNLNTLMHQVWDGSRWVEWETLGGFQSFIEGDPVAVTSISSGRSFIDVFAKGLGDIVNHKQWDGSAWRNWENLNFSGGIIGNVSAVSPAPGLVDIFVRGADRRIFQRTFSGNRVSFNWVARGGEIVGDTVALSSGLHKINVFGKGTNGHLYHLALDGGISSGWEDRGGIVDSNITGTCWGPNRIDLFAKGTDEALHHIAWNGAWSGWENLGAPNVGGFRRITGNPTAISTGENRIDVFATAHDNTVWRRRWDGRTWVNWENLGGDSASKIAVIAGAVSQLDVFFRGPDNALRHRFWDGTIWHP